MFKKFKTWLKNRSLQRKLRKGEGYLLQDRVAAAERSYAGALNAAIKAANPYSAIEALRGLAEVAVKRGLTVKADEFAQAALRVAEQAKLSSLDNPCSDSLARCSEVLENSTARMVAQRLRIVRLVRLVGEQGDELGDMCSVTEADFAGCSALVTSRIGYPHWLHAIVLCEQAEQALHCNESGAAMKLIDRAQQISVEFSDRGPAALAVAQMRRELDTW
jgi:hypothetical protein